MEQKAAIQDALKTAADDAEQATLLGEMRSLTTKLYTMSGKAKARRAYCSGVAWFLLHKQVGFA